MNRLCTQIADKYGWGFANINLRTYYAEGAKTYGFEIAEQLGWQLPQHVVVAGRRRHAAAAHRARASASCARSASSTATLPKIYAAQAAGCAPVVNALTPASNHPDPVQARTRSPSRSPSATRPTASR